MSIDDKIKQQLEKDAADLELALTDKEGIFDLLSATFKGGMRRWVILMNVVIMAVTVVMVWSGYRFFTASQTQDYVFWGVCLLLSAYAQIAMKQWIWMEMNRSSLMREIKRVEIAVASLAAQNGGD